MKELTLVEMNDVSGAGFQQILNGSQNVFAGVVDATIGAVLLSLGASAAGGLQGGVTGNGSGGGILGFGVITTGIGSIWGAIQGAFTGAVWGSYIGAEKSIEYIYKGVDSWFAGTIGGWVPN